MSWYQMTERPWQNMTRMCSWQLRYYYSSNYETKSQCMSMYLSCRLCFALQGWQTNRHSNAGVEVNTRQTGCQHTGLITVSISPVSVIPWRSSLQEILFYTRAFLTFYVLCNPCNKLCAGCNPCWKAPYWCHFLMLTHYFWHPFILFTYSINATLSTVLLQWAASVFTPNARVSLF